jgi:hypothetical protein
MTTGTTTTGDGSVQSTNSPQQEQLLHRLASLEAALTAQDPEMKNHLREIHKLMIGHEELVHFLSDEQIAVIMNSQQVVTSTTLAVVAAPKKSKAAASTRSAGLGMEDL